MFTRYITDKQNGSLDIEWINTTWFTRYRMDKHRVVHKIWNGFTQRTENSKPHCENVLMALETHSHATLVRDFCTGIIIKFDCERFG